MAAEPGESDGPENELVSDYLVMNGDPLLGEYLKTKYEGILGILEELKKSKKDNREMELRLDKDALYLRSLMEKR